MNSVQLSIKAYIQARKRLITAYEKYIVLCKNVGQNSIILTEDIEPFAALSESIFWGISLFERKCKKDSDFISGIKYVSNTMKHCDEIFQIYSFCSPGIEISVQVSKNQNRPVFQEINIEPNLIFGEIEDIPIYHRNKNQREQYMKLIQGKSILEIMVEFDILLAKLYPSDLWNFLLNKVYQ